ncbi:MAG: hypothetical protein CMO01_04020 [Thalassobius sp.]|nr:hypothetical protein [Thalassovita sp.]
MNITIKSLFFLVLMSIFTSRTTQAQEVQIEIGKTEIGENETFQITIKLQNARLSKHSPFPEIPGLVQQGTSSTKTTSYVNGQLTSFESVTQNYKPTRKGTFVLAPFSMEINGIAARSPGATIKVTASSGNTSQKSDPFSNFWGNDSNNAEFVDVQEDAFFAITSNKKNVYVGEGFTLSISFYISLKNRARMEFDKISDQLGEILKKVKPQNCWEENYGIDKINPEYVTINNKQYTQYRMYQATFFPLNAEDIKIPSAGLRMIKYKVAKNPSFFGRNMQEDYKTFYSKAVNIKVRDLPPHPLSAQVNVGNFKLIEKLDNTMMETGKSYNYQYAISGEGNIASINEIEIPKQSNFDFFPPSTNTNINRGRNTISGSKTFSYQLQPREPGEFNLGDYFNWVYFNTETGRYDTLRSQYTIQVSGESKKNAEIASNNPGGFYDKISEESNKLSSLGNRTWLNITFNISLLLVLLVSAFMVWKKPS